jgi:hypothetical protein
MDESVDETPTFATELASPTSTPGQLLSPAGSTVALERFPHNLPGELGLILGQDSVAYAVMRDAGNPYALPVGGRQLSHIIREYGRREGIMLRRGDIADVCHYLQATAEMAGVKRDVWYRVAPVDSGIEVDLGDQNQTRVRVTAGKVEIIASGSHVLFYRTAVSEPMAML